MMNTLKNKAEKSTSHLREVHEGKIDAVSMTLSESRAALPGVEQMKVDFNPSQLHEGKTLVTARALISAMEWNYCGNRRFVSRLRAENVLVWTERTVRERQRY